MGNILNRNGLASRISKLPCGIEVESLLKSGVPRRHLRFVPHLEDHIQWTSKRDNLCRKIGSGFLIAIIGNRGTGKTQAASHAAVIAARGGQPVRYCKAMEVFLSVRATYTGGTQSEMDVINGFREPKLLIIDEMQQRGDTAFEDRILAYLIDRRYDDMSDTILIANLTQQALAESLDHSIVDRLRETGGIMEFNWTSFRDAEAQKAISNTCYQRTGMRYEDYLKTDHWASFKSSAIRSAGGKCQLCSSRGELHVHHKTYERLFHESLEDVIVLCAVCHGSYHANDKKDCEANR